MVPLESEMVVVPEGALTVGEPQPEEVKMDGVVATVICPGVDGRESEKCTSVTVMLDGFVMVKLSVEVAPVVMLAGENALPKLMGEITLTKRAEVE